jgi:hypothetical protein
LLSWVAIEVHMNFLYVISLLLSYALQGLVQLSCVAKLMRWCSENESSSYKGTAVKHSKLRPLRISSHPHKLS